MSREPTLSELVSAWELAPADKKPTPEEICRDCPELIPQVRQAIEDFRRGELQFQQTLPDGGDTSSPRFQEKSTDSFHSVLTDRPTQVGPYRILSIINEGGMGVVYKAERTAPVRQIVALKMILLGMDSREVVARFETERQALAMMDHPNIARVFDGGATESGRPYFVMEYVPGEPITGYCDKHNLKTQERLALFAQVCDAIHHAHLKGIIHRDIKPSNVLVSTPEGATQPLVKVIDFGIAKATSAVSMQREYFTEQGRIVGTFEYMSPEQAEMTSLDVDTRTDIYSLGVMLYELLTGALPFDPKRLRQSAYDEIRRIIREEDPPTPSTRLTNLVATDATDIARKHQTGAPAMARELRAELEWIPLMAMRKDRTRRYQSALDLGRDVRNYLQGKALNAGPESGSYRVKKFVSKHRGPLSAAAGMVAVALIAATVAFVLIVRARDRAVSAENVAVVERDRVVAALDSGSAFVANISMVARMLQELSDVRLAPAQRRLQTNLERYFGELVKLRGGPSAARSDRVMLGQHYNTLGVLQGARPEAVVTLRESLNVRRALAAEAPGDLARKRDVAGTLNNLAEALKEQGAPIEELEKVYRAAIDEFQSIERADPTAASDLAKALMNLGTVYREGKQPARANEMLEEAMKIRSRLAESRPRDPLTLRDLAQANHDLAILDFDQGRTVEASKKLNEELRLRKQVLVLTGPGADYYEDDLHAAATAAALVAQLQQQQGDVNGAQTSLADGITQWQTIAQLNPSQRRAEALSTKSALQLFTGDNAGALESATWALGADDTYLAGQLNYAHALLFNRRFDEAKAVYTRFARQTIPGDGRVFAQAALDDFDGLAKANRTTERTEEIRALLEPLVRDNAR